MFYTSFILQTSKIQGLFGKGLNSIELNRKNIKACVVKDRVSRMEIYQMNCIFITRKEKEEEKERLKKLKFEQKRQDKKKEKVNCKYIVTFGSCRRKI